MLLSPLLWRGAGGEVLTGNACSFSIIYLDSYPELRLFTSTGNVMLVCGYENFGFQPSIVRYDIEYSY
jgi:hypothetical protein